MYLISPFGAVSLLRLDDIQPYGLMIYRNKLRMIYTPYGVIEMQDRGMLLNCFTKYDSAFDRPLLSCG